MLTLPEENNNGLIIESNEDFQLVDEDMSRNGRSLAWILNNVVRKFSGYHAIHINGEF